MVGAWDENPTTGLCGDPWEGRVDSSESGPGEWNAVSNFVSEWWDTFQNIDTTGEAINAGLVGALSAAAAAVPVGIVWWGISASNDGKQTDGEEEAEDDAKKEAA